MPAIFSLGVISFWQAAGLLVLSKILFTGIGHGSRWHEDRRKKYWQSRFHDKWHNISEERKQEFMQRMKERACSYPEEETPHKE